MTLGWLIILVAMLAGAGMGLQAPTNALLVRGVGSVASAALVSFIVGSLGLAILAALTGARVDTGALRALPWYAWLGGVYGAFYVAVAAFAAPRIGVGALLTSAIAGQLVMAVALDHFGAMGVERQPVNALRLAGVVLVLGGAVLVQRA